MAANAARKLVQLRFIASSARCSTGSTAGADRAPENLDGLRYHTLTGRAFPLVLTCLAACASRSGNAPRFDAPGDRLALFEEITRTVRDEFFDPALNGVDWDALCARTQPLAERSRTRADFARVINGLLGELRTSHTEYLTPDDPRFYDLADIFWAALAGERRDRLFPRGPPQVAGIGILTEELGGEAFVRGVLEGSPAAAAGLARGDRILAVEGAPFHPVHSFLARAGRPTRLLVQGGPRPSSARELVLVPEEIRPSELYLRALRASGRVIERGSARLGYAHVWAWTGDEAQAALQTLLLDGPLEDAQGLLLDLRDGYGGANPDYLGLLARAIPRLELIERSGERRRIASSWSKPVVLLVDQRTTSGKEVFADAFQRSGRGRIVGARTAGAVVGGRAFLVQDGSLLYLAVCDVLADGRRLEGVGVTPDVDVPFPPAGASGAGRDPQLERGLDVLVEEIAARGR